ncbi:MAG: 2-amino-4-hydroxy-6-hydroxymethyldihydropteridine diphosphokinase [Bacillota bacterium]|jgi:2-amino-4-hydroxy-6-hydroxymethyldihydropteridine diphosphokinase
MKMSRVFIGLGSNLDDRLDWLQQAVDLIMHIEQVSFQAKSSVYQTSPWGRLDQPDFYNAVIELKYPLSAQILLQELQKIEKTLGRKRTELWGRRNIDLDILLYGDEIIDTPKLKVPHPYLSQRLFVLYPLYELDQNLIIPLAGRVADLLEKLLSKDSEQQIKMLIDRENW